MTKTGARPPEISMDDQFQLVESHRPYLDAGNYLIEVGHTLNVGDGDHTFAAPKLNLNVLGARFSLPEDMIHAVFPAPGAQGKFDSVLPHVLVNHSTLPWERMPLGEGAVDPLSPSWLALLVFSEEQAQHIKSKTVQVGPTDDTDTSATLTSGGVNFGADLPIEVGQHASDQVKVIDVPFDILSSVVPRYHDLEALTHVRRVSAGTPKDGLSIRRAEGKDDATGLGEGPAQATSPERAVIVANRLPPKPPEPTPDNPHPNPAKCQVHLVSLERRYRDMDSDQSPPEADPRKAHKMTSTKLATWLRQAHAQRLDKGGYGVDLMLMMDAPPMLRTVMDRNHPRADVYQAIAGEPDLDILDPSDAYCRDLIGDEPHWLELLKKNETVNMTRPLSDAKGVIGLFDVTIIHNDWAPAHIGSDTALTIDDMAFLEEVTPKLDGTQDVIFALEAPVAASGKVQTTLKIWSSALALETLTPLLANTQKLLKLPAPETAPDDLGAAMMMRLDLSDKVNAALAAQSGLSDTKALENAAKSLSTPVLKVRFDIGDVRLGAQITLQDGACNITVTGRTPLLMATVRALRNEPVFGTGDESGNSLVRLVSLKTWSFENSGEDKSFTQLMLGLNAKKAEQDNLDDHTDVISLEGGFHLPIPMIGEHADVDERAIFKAGQSYLQAGSVALPHTTRSGETTLSWYRGPFVNTNFKPHKLPLPARGTDELLVYDNDVGMFDVSYAAAWELGRLITLKDNDFAMALFHWKREHARSLAQLRQSTDYDFLPLDPPEGPSAPAATLTAVFDGLSRLEQVPFNYLVPDEAMLPPDSMRFFDVDPMWLEALRDGAFSIGRVLPKDRLEDIAHHADLIPPARLSGVLIRSNAIGDWQNLRVDGYTAIDRNQVDLASNPGYFEEKLILERFARLGPDLLLCLFSDPLRHSRPVEMIDVHLPAEILHSGLDVSAQDSARFIKNLRNPLSGLPLHSYSPVRATVAKNNPHARYVLPRETSGLLKSSGIKPSDLALLDDLRGREFMSQSDLIAHVPGLSEHTKTVLKSLIFAQIPTEEHVEDVAVESGKFDVMRLHDEVANHLAGAYDPGHRFSSADFALQILQLPPIVRFVRPKMSLEGSLK